MPAVAHAPFCPPRRYGGVVRGVRELERCLHSSLRVQAADSRSHHVASATRVSPQLIATRRISFFLFVCLFCF